MVDFSGLRVKLLSSNAKLPTAAHNSAGYDLYNPMSFQWPIFPGQRITVPLRIATEMPYGYFGKIFDRSGLAAKNGITVLGGVIDNDYRGEWKVVLLNTDDEDIHTIYPGDRIAQVVFLPYGHFPVNQVDELQDSERGEGGFGSTGR
jgi:dUTP pyrophosphatase